MNTRARDPRRLTAKQRELMDILLTGNVNDSGVRLSWCDTEQIVERAWGSCREALISSLRRLESKGLVEHRYMAENRRDRRRSIYVPTDLAFDTLRQDEPAVRRAPSLATYQVPDALLGDGSFGESVGAVDLEPERSPT